MIDGVGRQDILSEPKSNTLKPNCRYYGAETGFSSEIGVSGMRSYYVLCIRPVTKSQRLDPEAVKSKPRKKSVIFDTVPIATVE